MSGQQPIPNEQAYQGVRALNPPDIISSRRNPNTNDRNYPLGTMWLNTVSQVSYQLIANPGIWSLMGIAGGDLSTLSSDAGVAVPAAGDIAILGGNNMDTSAAGSTITIATTANPVFTTLTTTGDILSTGGGVFADTGISTADGGVTATFGDIVATNDNIVALAGSVNAATGLSTIAGGVLATAGDITATTGDLVATAGDLIVLAGDVTVGQGDLDVVLGGIASGGSISAGTTMTAGTGLTVSLGNAALTNGDVVLTDGDVVLNGIGAITSLTGNASQYRLKGGAATDFIGSATLVAGTVTVANTNIAAADRIFIQRITPGGTPGHLSYAISAGVNFTINSSDAADTSTVGYFIVRQT